jgi:uncharacterized protein (DUF305 family)
MKLAPMALGVAVILAGMAPAVALDLPAICTTGADAGMGAMNGMSMDQSAMSMDQGSMGIMPTGDAAHQDLMSGMGTMNQQMMQGGTAADIDVAFICAMMPHHQGAIDMAKAELAHGDDPWAKELAQKIIDAQQHEISQMQGWLAKQPQ